jgi:hypothetical protein
MLVLAGHITAPAQNTAPRPLPTALENVRLAVSEDAPTVTLLLRDGRIAGVLEGESTPPGFVKIDCEGALALPAFIDAGSDGGCEMGEGVVDQDRPLNPQEGVLTDMRRANRKGLRPAFRAADVLALPEDGESWRAQGFGSVLVCPHGELLSGTSCLVIPREAAPRDTVVQEGPYQHAAFQASGSGYPNTLMGYHAQLRQFFEDSRHQGLLTERRAAGRPGPRPPLDRDLEAGLDLLTGGRLMCDANTARDILRWIRLADEYGIAIAIRGGNEAWRVADTLAEREIPVILTLDWGEEVEDPLADEEEEEEEDTQEPQKGEPKPDQDPDADTGDGEAPEKAPEEAQTEGKASEDEGAEDEEESDPWVYEEPLELRLERRRLWAEKRDGVQRLVEAGVPFAFGSGSGKPKDLLKRVRTLVEEGLDRDLALAALTEGAGRILAAPAGTGTLRVGSAAHIALWDRDPLGEKKSRLRWIVLDGFPEQRADEDEGDSDPPDEGLDLTGSWDFEFASDHARPASGKFVMEEDGTLTADCVFASPGGDSFPMEMEGRVFGHQMLLKGKAEPMEGVEIKISLRGKIKDDDISGKVRWKGPGFDESSSFTGTRKPESDRRTR